MPKTQREAAFGQCQRRDVNQHLDIGGGAWRGGGGGLKGKCDIGGGARGGRQKKNLDNGREKRCV